EPVDDGVEVAVAVGRQGCEIGLGVGEKSRGDRNSGTGRRAILLEHRVHQSTSGAPVAVVEWVDRLELSVRDSGLREQRYVSSCDERAQIVNGRRHARMVGWHERRG